MRSAYSNVLVPVAAVVVERLPRRPRHRPVEDEADPVAAALHLQHRLRRRFGQRLAPVDARRHVEQIGDPQRPLVGIDVRDAAIGERRQHRFVDAEDAVVGGDGDERADDRLGDRVDGVAQPRPIRSKGRLGDDPAVAHDEDAVHVVRGSEIDQLGEHGGGGALRLGGRRFPTGGRPRRCRGRHRLGGSGAAHQQRQRPEQRERTKASASATDHVRRDRFSGFAARLPSARRRPTTPVGK
jgi:hypothetical protein